MKLQAILLLAVPCELLALDYAYQTAEPQKSGWPLTAEERAFVLKPEHERRPGSEAKQHKPKLWPVMPSAGFWGGTSWLDTHAGLVDVVASNRGPIDALLVGDSITQQWGPAWTKHFPGLKTVNIGIGGDKTQNVLWRLDHGGVDGLQPRVIVLMIGNNNMFFTPETGIEPVAQGIRMCVTNLREKFPHTRVIVAKILPAHAPGNRFYEDIRKTNLALDALKLEADPQVTVLDLWNDMVNADGTLKADLFAPDLIHLTQDGGYALYARRLKPVVDARLAAPLAAPGKPADLVAVTAADDARVAAFVAPSRAKLDGVLSDELHYAHSSGAVDTKASLVEALLSGKIQYHRFEYETRAFSFPAPDIALMTGRARVQATAAGTRMDAAFSFLAVWRREGGTWKFLAWQSCRLPPAPAL